MLHRQLEINWPRLRATIGRILGLALVGVILASFTILTLTAVTRGTGPSLLAVVSLAAVLAAGAQLAAPAIGALIGGGR